MKSLFRLTCLSVLSIIALATVLGESASAGRHRWCYSDCIPCGSAWSDCEVQYQTVEKTIYVPEVTWETRQEEVRVCKPEVRQVPYTVMKQVVELKPVTREYTVMEAQQRVRVENYTVCKPVMRSAERQVTVMEPEQQVREGVHRYCKPVQVEEMVTVCRDRGHYEERQVAVECGSRCGHCGCRSRCGHCGGNGCCDSCGAPAVTVCRVWVPNIVEEQQPRLVWRTKMVEEPYQYQVTVCKPVVKNVTEQVCDIEREQKSREVPYTICVPKVVSKTEEVRVCRYVPEEQMREITVMVPSTEMREVRVPVCKMVPKVITCRIPVPVYQQSSGGCWGCCSPCN
jgi:hypothetical protein